MSSNQSEVQMIRNSSILNAKTGLPSIEGLSKHQYYNKIKDSIGNYLRQKLHISYDKNQSLTKELGEQIK